LRAMVLALLVVMLALLAELLWSREATCCRN
jgi:hypothetical protein